MTLYTILGALMLLAGFALGNWLMGLVITLVEAWKTRRK